ncbi:SHOCT-like domain-containing protein [Actinomadura oligospora]|uniref:SHOCT-like domain-containing protein n=1 Tax=Actinomadura oligospora TaxID=111804 RepID=UPI00047DDF7F|nr:hypothetical protein [Actinomadura oligospora]
MDEQHRQVLHLLADDKVTVDEAERLIDALEPERPESAAGAATPPNARLRYLRVVVQAEGDAGEDGPTRINIRIPLQLLRAGVRLASLVPPPALARANAALSRSGVPIDLTDLRPQDIEALVDHLDEVSIDLDDPGAKVQVFCE